MKLGWNLVKRKDALWVQVVRDKYKCGMDLIPRVDPGRPGSNVWSGIKQVWEKVKSGVETDVNGNVRWKWTKCGSFTVNSAHDLLRTDGNDSDPLWSKIWKLRVPERRRMFIWLVAHKRLLTNASRKKRGLSSSDECPICCSVTEDMLHVLRDCPNTLNLWRSIVPQMKWQRFSSMEFPQWLKWNLMMNDCRGDEVWRATFAITCWWIWRRRNLFVFESKTILNSMVMSSVQAMIRSIREAHDKLVEGGMTNVPSGGTRFSWVPPEPGWVKLNVDGAFSQYNHVVAAGGLIRDEYGNFIRGFTFSCAEGDALSAELWGCIHGLKIAWDMGFRKIILESDSTEAISLILNEREVEIHADSLLIQEAIGLLQRQWEVSVNYVSRWINVAADLLAKEGLSSMPGVHFVTEAPEALVRIIVKEKG